MPDLPSWRQALLARLAEQWGLFVVEPKKLVSFARDHGHLSADLMGLSVK